MKEEKEGCREGEEGEEGKWSIEKNELVDAVKCVLLLA